MALCTYAQALQTAGHEDNPEELTSRPAAAIYGVAKSTVGNHRAGDCACSVVSTGESGVSGETHRPDGSADYVTMSETAWGYEDFRRFITSKGQDPDAVTFTWGVTSTPQGGYFNKLNNVRPISASEGAGPEWPVIQQAAPVSVIIANRPTAPIRGMKLALKGADTQIGFRRLPDGSLDPFHDYAAMEIFTQAALKM